LAASAPDSLTAVCPEEKRREETQAHNRFANSLLPCR